VQQDTKEVLAELVGKRREKLDPKVGGASAGGFWYLPQELLKSGSR